MPNPVLPARMIVISCSICDAYLGIRDVDRMQHEHFEVSERCRGGMYVAMVYDRAMVGTYADALAALAEDAS